MSAISFNSDLRIQYPYQRALSSYLMEASSGGKKIPAAATVLLAAATVIGGALLLWWTVAFHRSNEQLWMVPVSLIFLGTSAITCFSFLASGDDPENLQLLAKPPAADLWKTEETV